MSDRLKYGTFQLGDGLGKFDFAEERKEYEARIQQQNKDDCKIM